MDQITALKVVKEALNQATQKGAFNMQDVATIVSALQIISNVLPTKTEVKELNPEITK
jgi:hypothetical protein